MSKKKTEHSLFDQMNRRKNSIPFDKVNTGSKTPRPQAARGAVTQHRSVSHGR